MRVAVVGGSGWLGSAVAARLKTGALDVAAVHHGEAAPADAASADLLDPQSLFDLIEARRPDVVVHAAGRIGGDAGFSELYRIHVEGTANLIDAMQAHVPAARLIVLGSAAEYGPGEAGSKIDESHLCRPSGHYGLSKLLQTELVVQASRCSDLQATVLRLFNPIGPGMRPGLLLPDLFAQLRRLRESGGDVLEVANLDAVRDLVPVDVVVEAVARVVSRGGPAGVFNVASGTGTRIGDLLDWLRGASDFDWSVAPVEAAPHRSGGGWSVGNPAALEAELGAIPGPSAKEAVVAAYRRDVLEQEKVG